MFFTSEDLTIHITRGDVAPIFITANTEGLDYEFAENDVVRLKVFTKKNCGEVVLQKDVKVTETTNAVEVLLTGKDTKIGEVISKPVEYWYEVELNPDTNPQTIIGYDENGAKVFKLYPEGGEVNE